MSINAYNASTISALFAGLNNSSSGTSLSYGIDFTTYNSMWSKVDKTDKNGNTAKEYDTDKIAKAVSSFVKNYNSLVSSTADSSSRYVLNSASNMVNYTRANADLLKKIGISVGSDNKLTVDEDKLKASDMAVVKSVFKDSGSFGQTISAKASTIYGNAVSQLS